MENTFIMCENTFRIYFNDTLNSTYFQSEKHSYSWYKFKLVTSIANIINE